MQTPTLNNATLSSPKSPQPGDTETGQPGFAGATSDFVTAKPRRKSARLSSALLDYKRPEGLNMVALGSSSSVDVFVRPHNGLRRELIDMYNMIDSMQRRVNDLRTADLFLFFDWWNLFASYLQITIQVTNDMLVPWALGEASTPTALAVEVRDAGKQGAKSLIDIFEVVFQQLHRRPPDESLAKMIKGLVHIHPIFKFVQAVENTLPEIVEGKYSDMDVSTMERAIALHYHKNGDITLRRFHLVVMARGMTDEIFSAWKRCLPPLVRFTSKALKPRFAAQHLGVVEKLALVD